MWKMYIALLEHCQQCPNYRSDRYDSNPDVGGGRGSWCKLTQRRIDDRSDSPRFNGTRNTPPPFDCPLPDENKVEVIIK